MARISPAVLLAACALLAQDAPAQRVTVESLIGGSATTVDVKADAPIAHNVGVFARYRVTNDYAGTPRQFGLVDLTYPVSKHATVFAEGQFYSDASPEPKIGLGYARTFGDVSVMVSGVFWKDATLQTITGYSPRRAKPLSLQLETFLSADKNGYAFSIQRARVGMERGKLFIGVGADFNQALHARPDYNVGVVLKYRR
jgi:hypothetical protein